MAGEPRAFGVASVELKASNRPRRSPGFAAKADLNLMRLGRLVRVQRPLFESAIDEVLVD